MPTAQFSPAPLFAPPTWRSQLPSAQLPLNRLGQTSAYCPVPPPNWTKSKLHFAISNLGPLHRRPCVGGGHSLEPSAQVGPISEHRPEGGGALGLPTAPSPSPQRRAERAGQPSDPAVGTRSKKEGPGTACPGL